MIIYLGSIILNSQTYACQDLVTLDLYEILNKIRLKSIAKNFSFQHMQYILDLSQFHFLIYYLGGEIV